jgi:putative ABC transport system substrate-binding protein
MMARILRHILPLLLIFCFTAEAQAAGRLVAAVLTGDTSRYRDAHRAFVKALAQKGYDQGNMDIVVQSPNPDPLSWANAIRKFNALGADVIVTYGAPATIAAMREAEDIPVVFVDVYGPVETGIARSNGLTGRNVTGVSSKVPMMTLIKTAIEIRPIVTMGVLYNSREIGSVVQLKEIKRLAAQYGFAVTEANVASATGLDTALNSMIAAKVDCIFATESAIVSRGFEKIIHRANAGKIPVLSLMPDSCDKGGLVSLEVNPAEQGQLAADYAAKILSGKKAGQLPISSAKKVELIVNLRAAKALDLHVPFQVLNAATKIVK